MSDVNSAASNYANDSFDDGKFNGICDAIYRAFLAGAAWQREQDELDKQMFLNEHDENVRLHTHLEEVVELLDKINGAFYTRTSKKEWLALMEKTKPLITKVRAQYFRLEGEAK